MTDETREAGLNAEIEALQAKGDVAGANLKYQELIGTVNELGPDGVPLPIDGGNLPAVVEGGDAPAGDDAAPAPHPDDIDPAYRAGMEGYTPWDSLTVQEQDEEFDRVQSRAEPENALAEHRVTYPGGELPRSAEFVTATMQAIPGTANVVQVLESVGIADHPDIYNWVHSVGRLLAAKSGDPSTITSQTGNQEMTETNAANIQARIDALQDKIDEDQAVGEYDTANSLYREQLELGRKLPGGDDVIVGGGGRTT